MGWDNDPEHRRVMAEAKAVKAQQTAERAERVRKMLVEGLDGATIWRRLGVNPGKRSLKELKKIAGVL